MPRIFDNISLQLLPALRQTLELSHRADFCVGYFNLRGWRGLADQVDCWAGGDGQQCRVLIGMPRTPDEELHALYSLAVSDDGVDQQEVLRLKRKLADEFRRQLTIGAPANEDEAGLRRLRQQLKDAKVVVKLFLRHSLHAKLYLAYRTDPNNPIIGFVGSSNLTMAGLSKQGELNVDVLDHDACEKLRQWFEDRWSDRWCLDITQELADLIEESWAREEIIPPYHIYLKMAYHLSREAQTAISEFSIPRDFGQRLFEFQVKAVQIGAHHVNRREGVLIGDVVGLGKGDKGWRALHLVAAPKNRGNASSIGLGHQLRRQPRLADPRLAGEQDDASGPLSRPRQRFPAGRWADVLGGAATAYGRAGLLDFQSGPTLLVGHRIRLAAGP